MPIVGRSSPGGAIREAIRSGHSSRKRLAASSAAESVDVRCGECGSRFSLSTRRAFEWRRQSRSPMCQECRHPERTMSAAERERFRQWWLEQSGLSRAELLEISLLLS